MTLSTDIYIQGNVPAADVFEFVLAQLLEFDADQRPRERVVEHSTPTCFGTRLGQGLPAILSVYCKESGPWRTAEESQAHDSEICNIPGADYYTAEQDDCDGTGCGHEPACHLEVNLDTGYGYQGPRGMRCSDLHAVIIVRLGRWLTERNVAYAWRNEYTGEIHKGEDGIEGFLSSGVDADRWFDNVAMPAIQRAIAGASEGGAVDA